MKTLVNKIMIFLWVILMLACSEEDVLLNQRNKEYETKFPDKPVTEKGSLDFSNPVFLGNSMTAGYMDFALYDNGQVYSYANMLHKALATLEGADQELNNPDINSANGFNPFFSDLENEVIKGRTVLDPTIPGPAALDGEFFGAFSGEKSTLNNFGVPGLLLPQLILTETGTPQNPLENPYYTRFATAPGTSTIFSDALGVQPSFVSIWMGQYDVLGYALSGGDGSVPITETSTYEAIFSQVIGQLATSGIPATALSSPPVITLPFFNAVEYNVIELTQIEVDQLNPAFAGFNAILDALVANLGHDAEDAAQRKVIYVEGNNPILVADQELEDLGPKFDILLGAGAITQEQRDGLRPYEQARPLTTGELVLMTAGALLGTNAAGDNTPIGVVIPLGLDIQTMEAKGDKYWINLQEKVEIITARATYNGIMKSVMEGTSSTEVPMFYINLDNFYADLLGFDASTAGLLGMTTDTNLINDGQGHVINGIRLTPDFAPSGVYSTDGLHLNPRGNAIIANEVLNVLSRETGLNSDPLPVLDFRSIILKQ